MTTLYQSIQIIFTLIVSGACTILALQFVTIAKEKVNLHKWFVWTIKSLIVVHIILFPISLINMIWSF